VLHTVCGEAHQSSERELKSENFFLNVFHTHFPAYLPCLRFHSAVVLTLRDGVVFKSKFRVGGREAGKFENDYLVISNVKVRGEERMTIINTDYTQFNIKTNNRKLNKTKKSNYIKAE
jgi:transcriptional antiterminator Rof (Rho-off)